MRQASIGVGDEITAIACSRTGGSPYPSGSEGRTPEKNEFFCNLQSPPGGVPVGTDIGFRRAGQRQDSNHTNSVALDSSGPYSFSPGGGGGTDWNLSDVKSRSLT